MSKIKKHKTSPIIGGNKIKFIHHLRGIAPLIVVFAHFFIDLFQNKFIMGKTFNKINWLNENNLTDKVLKFSHYIYNDFLFNINIFAVSLFFLISGYVITASIEKYSLLIFVKKRFFRLYPAYIIATLISFTFICLYYHVTGVAMPITLEDFLVHLTMIPQILNYDYFDIITWTLQIEFFFYFFSVVSYKLINAKRPYYIILAWFLKVFLLYIYFKKLDKYNTYTEVFFMGYLLFCPYIFIGLMTYYYDCRKINLHTFLILILSSVAFIYIAKGQYTKNYQIHAFKGGALSLSLFISLYFASSKGFYRPPSFIDSFLNKLADYSYALYLSHAVPGIFIIYYFYPNLYLSYFFAFIYTIFATYIISRVENKFRR